MPCIQWEFQVPDSSGHLRLGSGPIGLASCHAGWRWPVGITCGPWDGIRDGVFLGHGRNGSSKNVTGKGLTRSGDRCWCSWGTIQWDMIHRYDQFKYGHNCFSLFTFEGIRGIICGSFTSIDGHFRNLNWGYLPYIWYQRTSILGSWNSLWNMELSQKIKLPLNRPKFNA
jgi:hypothetical protein